MVSKKSKKVSVKKTAKKSSAKPMKVKPNENYLPRAGTLPAKIFAHLAGRPMLFGELSVHVGKEIGLTGDSLTSQLSAALYDLCHRSVVIRLDHRTNKPVPPKNARGALYALTDKVKTHYLGAGRGAISFEQKSVAPSVVQFRSGDYFAGGGTNGALSGDVTGPSNGRIKPSRMSPAMFAELSAAKAAAEKQLAAIKAMLEDSAWV